MRKKIILILTIFLISTSLTGCVDNVEDKKLNPIADFSYEPSKTWIENIVFFNSTSYDPDGYITNWTWDFGDGDVAYGENVSHMYKNYSIYDVTLVVKDNENKFDSIEYNISIYKYPFLDLMSLTLDDLPEGYVRLSEGPNVLFGINSTEPALEVFGKNFIYEDPENNTGFPLIINSLVRYNSSVDAEKALINSSKSMDETFDQILPRVPVEVNMSVGNQSIYRLYQGISTEEYYNQSATWSYIYFRFNDIVAVIIIDEIPSSNISYVDLTFQYAKNVEERILYYFNR
jgi:PKD repeat protein